ncbi:MAG: ATP-binding protein, partial [Variovorax sp.]
MSARSTAALFHGIGELRQFARTFDWAASPLGEPETWPSALVTCFQLCLDTPLSMALCWGPELRMLYGDAYRPVLADKHPSAFAQPLHTVWPETRHVIDAHLSRVLEQGSTYSALNQRFDLWLDGGLVEKYFNFSFTPVKDASGQVLGVILTVQDTTNGMVAARERALADDALRRLNETLEARVAERTAERDRIWRISREILVVANRQGRFESVNPAFGRVLGWSAAEATHGPFLALVHPDDLPMAQAQFSAFLNGTTTSASFAVRMRHCDGSYRYLDWTAASEGDAIYGVARDVTEARELAQSLAEAEDQLRQAQKMEAVGQLTGGIAHDFNNMLGTITTSLELMRRQVDAKRLAELPRYIAMAQASAERAASLTHRLLAFSRHQPLDARPVDVNTLVQGMNDLLRRTLGEGVSLAIVLADDAGMATTDANQLENALLNLVINARDAMPAGGKLTIETMATELDASYAAHQADVRPGPYVLLSVSDTGTGMTSEVIAKAFDPFFTTKPAGQGTGLGLSMIYGYVKQSSGHVAIHSHPGQGSTITLYLPRHKAGPPALQEQQAKPALPAGSGERILVVEDEAPLRAIIVETLTRLGYSTEQAGDAAAALAAMGAGPIYTAATHAVLSG